MSDVVDDLWWRAEDANYPRQRSLGYPGATNIEPGWTLEAVADRRRVVLDPQWDGSARVREAGPLMSSSREQDDAAVADEVRAVRAEYADEEAEAAGIEAAQAAASLDVPLSLRITRDLDAALKETASAQQISPSALVRRILRDALDRGSAPVLTTAQVEQIARRVMRESA